MPTLIEQGTPRPEQPEEAWAKAALATRLAIEVVDRSGLHPARDLWEALLGRYTFLYPSRERPLVMAPRVDPRTGEYLLYIKGPLLLRSLSATRRAEGMPKLTFESRARILDHLGSQSFTDMVERTLGEAGHRLLEAAMNDVGFLIPVVPRSLDLEPLDTGKHQAQEGRGAQITLVSVPQVYPRWIHPEEYERRTTWLSVKEPLRALQGVAEEASELHESPHRLVIVYGTIAPWHVAHLVEEFPGIDLIVSGERYAPPAVDGWIATGEESRMTAGLRGLVGETLVVFSNMGEYGIAFLRLAVENGRVRAHEIEGVKLLSDMPKDEETVRRLDESYASLEFSEFQKPPLFGDFELESLLHQEVGGYVGVEFCRNCHAEICNTFLASMRG